MEKGASTGGRRVGYRSHISFSPARRVTSNGPPLRPSASAPANIGIGRFSMDDFESTFGVQEGQEGKEKRRGSSGRRQKLPSTSSIGAINTLTKRSNLNTFERSRESLADQSAYGDQTIRGTGMATPVSRRVHREKSLPKESVYAVRASSTSLWKDEPVPDTPLYARPEKLSVLSADEVSVCTQCGKEVLRREKKRHDEVSCAGRMVVCRNPGCGKMVLASQQRLHERSKCKFAKLQAKILSDIRQNGEKILICDLGCGKAVPRADIPRHQMLDCPQKTIPCPNGVACKDLVTREKMESHLKVCRVGLKNKAYFEASKERRETKIPCSPNHKFGCGKMLLRKELSAHEKNECPNRLVQCRNLGCKEMVRLNLRSFHEDRFCEVKKAREEMLSWGQEILDCELGCGAELTVREVAEHKKDKCPNRIVECNVTGCNEKLYACYQKNHETLWEKMVDPATGNDYYINTETQETSWEKQGCPLLRTRHKYLMLLNEHSKKVACPLNCGKEYVNCLAELKKHQERCPNVPIPCVMAGCKMKVLRGSMKFHLEDECEAYLKRNLQASRARSKRGMSRCPQCDIQLPKIDVNFHIRHWCPEKPWFCDKEGCSASVSYKTQAYHALYECVYWEKMGPKITAARMKQTHPLPWVAEKLGRKG